MSEVRIRAIRPSPIVWRRLTGDRIRLQFQSAERTEITTSVGEMSVQRTGRIQEEKRDGCVSEKRPCHSLPKVIVPSAIRVAAA